MTGLPVHILARSMVGRQTPFLALVVPFVLVFMVDGRRGLRESWPAALIAGFCFAVAQFAVSNYASIQLTDIIASLVSVAVVVGLTRVWSPRTGDAQATAGGRRPAIAGGSVGDAALERRKLADEGRPIKTKDRIMAFAPYLIIIVVLGITSITAVHLQLDKATSAFKWPGSGQTITLGMWAAGAGGFFAFLSPRIGWFGTAVTGSDTSSNCYSARFKSPLGTRQGSRRRCWRAPTARGECWRRWSRLRTSRLAPPRLAWPGGKESFPPGDRLEPRAGAADGDPRAAPVRRPVLHGPVARPRPFQPPRPLRRPRQLKFRLTTRPVPSERWRFGRPMRHQIAFLGREVVTGD